MSQISANPVSGNVGMDSAFQTAIANGHDDNYVYFQGGRVNQEGFLGHVFTRASVNRATVNALKSDIIAKYGETVGDALAPKFDTIIRAGTQMKVKDVRLLMAQASVLAKLPQVIADNPAWSESDREIFKGAVMDTVKMCPGLVADPAEADKMLKQLTNVMNNDGGSGEYFCRLGDPAQKRDLLQAMAVLGLRSSGACYFRHLNGVIQNIRASKPEGPLSQNALWKGLFGKDMPKEQNGLSYWQSHAGVDKAFDELLTNGLLRQGAVPDPEEGFADILFPISSSLDNGLSLDTATRLFAHKGTLTKLTMADFAEPPILEPAKGPLNTIDEGIKQFKADFHRQEKPSAVIISGHGLSPYINDNRTGVLHEDGIIDHLKEMCGENQKQLRTAVWSLTQKSPMLVSQRMVAHLTGRPSGLLEHSAMVYDFHKEENGDITLLAKSPDGYKGPNGEKLCSLNAEFVIHPDGTTETKSFTLTPEE